MATAVSLPAATPSTDLTDDQQRWVVIGICLNKLLTPILRNVLGKEIPVWYNSLCLSPNQINKQTYKKHAAKLPPSKQTLNYHNINKNYDNHKLIHNAYDYNIKDPESLAKLFVQPFMAKFSGFDQTMDLSAALTVMCEADPFYTSGAAALANTVRKDVRNEWAHCDFSHWNDVNYVSCIQNIESLVKKLKLSSDDENDFVNELNNWKDKGVQLCCGQPVDADLLKLITTEVSQLYDFVQIWRDEIQDVQIVLKNFKENLNKLETLSQIGRNKTSSIVSWGEWTTSIAYGGLKIVVSSACPVAGIAIGAGETCKSLHDGDYLGAAVNFAFVGLDIILLGTASKAKAAYETTGKQHCIKFVKEQTKGKGKEFTKKIGKTFSKNLAMGLSKYTWKEIEKEMQYRIIEITIKVLQDGMTVFSEVMVEEMVEKMFSQAIKDSFNPLFKEAFKAGGEEEFKKYCRKKIVIELSRLGLKKCA